LLLPLQPSAASARAAIVPIKTSFRMTSSSSVSPA
jgi:hypothetical protein